VLPGTPIDPPRAERKALTASAESPALFVSRALSGSPRIVSQRVMQQRATTLIAVLPDASYTFRPTLDRSDGPSMRTATRFHRPRIPDQRDRLRRRDYGVRILDTGGHWVRQRAEPRCKLRAPNAVFDLHDPPVAAVVDRYVISAGVVERQHLLVPVRP
jgi:hypothetical protein